MLKKNQGIAPEVEPFASKKNRGNMLHHNAEYQLIKKISSIFPMTTIILGKMNWLKVIIVGIRVDTYVGF